MSAIDTRTSARREAAKNAAERRKKLMLVGLMVVFAALLAFQLPKLLKGSDTSSSSAPAPAATAATAATTAADPTQLLASSSTAVSAKRVRAIRSMSPKDPFVPLIRERTSSSSPPLQGRPRGACLRGRVAACGRRNDHLLGAGCKARSVRPLKPTAAVLWTNGRRLVVGVGQLFKVGDATFKLVAVDRKNMRFQVSGGSFAGGKRTITVRKGHLVTLANSATGVRYVLRFAAADDGCSDSSPRCNANPDHDFSLSTGDHSRSRRETTDDLRQQKQKGEQRPDERDKRSSRRPRRAQPSSAASAPHHLCGDGGYQRHDRRRRPGLGGKGSVARCAGRSTDVPQSDGRRGPWQPRPSRRRTRGRPRSRGVPSAARTVTSSSSRRASTSPLATP